ncbi:hypothetical protein AXFE_20220 [Acidithrix ferrooxidans]|uniref:Uncharacterized protein n=1 Tax=Acidithrix ferrooxidans TaxID=1280514 RepID=A0A0D8HGY5_9ACTN|nr:hypothetical protein AXFE_20220 [Acidithrix ferrooxidans]
MGKVDMVEHFLVSTLHPMLSSSGESPLGKTATSWLLDVEQVSIMTLYERPGILFLTLLFDDFVVSFSSS